MAERSITALGVAQFPYLKETDPLKFRDHQLRYPVAIRNYKRLSGVINQNNPYLTAIITIDRPRRVQNGDSILSR